MNKLQEPPKTQKEDKIKSFSSLEAKIEKRRQRAQSAKRKRLVIAIVCVAAVAALVVCAGLYFDVPAMVREAIYYHRDAPPAEPGAPKAKRRWARF